MVHSVRRTVCQALDWGGTDDKEELRFIPSKKSQPRTEWRTHMKVTKNK